MFVLFFLVFLVIFAFGFVIWYVATRKSTDQPLRRLHPSLTGERDPAEDRSIFYDDSELKGGKGG
jgi:hypothetical protein